MPSLKPVNYELIAADAEPYRLLDGVRVWHGDLAEARIALAWRINLNPDADGRLVLGKCQKVSDLHKELADYDFIVILNREAWDEFSDAQRLALLDHELSHATVARDQDGQPKLDERGRAVFRLRKHDIEEFRDVVARHGCYKEDLREFAEAVLEERKTPLLDVLSEVASERAHTPAIASRAEVERATLQ
jgi:hypothetical protein